jgi:hypothetical protein
MTLFEKLQKMPVDQAARFLFEISLNPCMFCAQNNDNCVQEKRILSPETEAKDWNEYEKAKRICVDQITVGLLQEVHKHDKSRSN